MTREEIVRKVVRGEEDIAALGDAGISVILESGAVKLLGADIAPVRVSEADVAHGWLRHSGSRATLRRWAQFVHGAVGLVDLSFDNSLESERLLDALWRANFGEVSAQELDDCARQILVKRA